MSSPLFPRWTNTAARASIAILVTIPALALGGLMVWVRMPDANNQFHPYEQPVQFDHRHHVADEGIDCRYCHTTVEDGPSAGIPSTTVCMSCHAQIWQKSPYLTEVREKFFNDLPIRWVRVHNLPDHVYFDHSIHVNKGVGCVSCHGRVDEMGAIEQVAPLTMSWCLDCHRNPGPNLRPVEEITSTTWTPPAEAEARTALAEALMEQYDVHPRVSCETCHR